MPFPILDAAQTARRLPMPALLHDLRQTVLDYAGGSVTAPERLAVSLPGGGIMLAMPAVARDLAVHKLVTICAGNRAAGQPTLQGTVTAYEAGTGTPLFMLDGPTVTAQRTAAVTLLGIEALHGPPRQVAIIGTGGQARAHLDALREVHPDARVSIVGRDLPKAARLAQATGVQAERAVPQEADVVITTTTSKTPVYDEPACAGRLVVAVGAFTADAAEIAAHVVNGSQLYVDDPAGARHEAGDLLQAGVDWARVHSLAEALERPPRPDRPSLFKSVGCAAWDLAACRTVRRRLQLG